MNAKIIDKLDRIPPITESEELGTTFPLELYNTEGDGAFSILLEIVLNADDIRRDKASYALKYLPYISDGPPASFVTAVTSVIASAYLSARTLSDLVIACLRGECIWREDVEERILALCDRALELPSTTLWNPWHGMSRTFFRTVAARRTQILRKWRLLDGLAEGAIHVSDDLIDRFRREGTSRYGETEIARAGNDKLRHIVAGTHAWHQDYDDGPTQRKLKQVLTQAILPLPSIRAGIHVQFLWHEETDVYLAFCFRYGESDSWQGGD